MAKKESLFDEDEKYPVKGLEYGFFIMGLGCSIGLLVIIFQDGPAVLFISGSGPRAGHWPGFLALLFSLAMTFYSMKAILKARRKKNDH